MRQETFTLPSSAKIEFRQVLLAEENKLSSAVKTKRMNIEKTLSEILTSCAVGIVDVGPYGFLEVGGKPKWEDMTRGDRFQAMIDLRCISYKDGEQFEADLRCPASTCGNRFDWLVDLRTDLVRVPMPEESIQHLKEGRPFEVVIDGRVVKYNVAIGKTEDVYTTLCEQNPSRDMACALRSRIVEVEGLRPHEILDWLDGRNGESDKFQGLTSQDAEELRDAFDKVDGGIDTTLEAECPKCHTWFDFSLPFSGIFLPGRGIDKRRKEARAKKERDERSSCSEDSTQTR